MPADYYRQHRPISNLEASRLRELANRDGQNIVLVDPVEDAKWARTWRDVKRPSDYFDYFFSGQDIRVRIAEIPENDAQFGDIPVAQLQLQVEQEKQPIYGFWDYTYSAVMRGTRLITGQLAVYTKYPNYMMDLLARAATNRANSAQLDNYNYPMGLTEDDKLIEQYWGRNLFDPGIAAQSGRHMFSVHPPFSLVIQYGMQPMSVPPATNADYEQWYVDYYSNRRNEMFGDINHRLVESDPSYENRLIVDGVELRSCFRSVTPDGAPLAEIYQFFARDIVVPTPPKPSSSTGGQVQNQITTPGRDPGLLGPAVPDF